jgi:anti-sigma B factor antagonist
MHPPHLAIRQDRNITFVRFLTPGLLDESALLEISRELVQVVESSPAPRILLDFTGVQRLSSAALGALVTLNEKVRHQEGQLRLACIDPMIREVFAITKLDSVLRIHDDAVTAVRRLT